jgi:hypothetical protein
MHTYTRPQLRHLPRTARQVPRAMTRSAQALPVSPAFVDVDSTALATPRRDDAYGEYSRSLTPDGGILIAFKTLDTRWRFTLWRAVAWSAFTWFEGWLLFGPPALIESGLMSFVCLLAMAAINFLIVRMPVTALRSVEIRPEGMIIDGTAMFWGGLMQAGWPAFQADEDDNHVLGGIYGTRFIEYLTAHHLDDCDRTPEVVAAHLQEAMQQLWAPGLAFGVNAQSQNRRR